VNLGELIARLETADPNQVVKHGFLNPHSYRGDYMDLAFEPAEDITVGEMLAAARSAVGATFQGWKGGDFVMHSDTWCWLSQQGDASGETISALLLELILAEPTEAPASAAVVPAADRADVGTEFVCQADHPDEAGFAAFEASLSRQSGPKADSKAAANRAALRDRIAAAVQPLLMDTLPKPIAAVRADEVADQVLAVLPAPADRAAVLLDAVRRIEDGELLPDRGLRFRRGADWVLDALRRLVAEAAGPADTVGSCAHCGKPVRRITGTLSAWWVHDPDGHTACHPEHAAASTRATPGPVVPAQPGNDTKAPQHAPGTAICCPDCRAKGHAVCAADKTPVVAYRSHSGSLLRCLTHAPDQTGLDTGAFHPVTAGDLPDGGVCTYRAPGVECGADVLNPQKP
jgi:hypothetical protein